MRQIWNKLLASACALALVLSTVPGAWAAPVFSDVGEGKWFKPYVDKAVDAGLMNGVGGDQFSPGGNLTLAQSAVLAYQLHSRASGEALPQASGAWYMPYYQYCLDHGILDGGTVPQSALNRNATRYEMVAILDRATPDRQLTAINELPDDFIPDVGESDPYRAAVYRWYRAGALAGDSQFRFNGQNSITRAEVSVILCQLNGLVERARIDPSQAPVTGLTMTIPQSSLTVGESTGASLTPKPSWSSTQGAVWSSSNPAAASVSETGVITARGAGTATITASLNGVKAADTVTVTLDPQALIDEVVRLTNAERAKAGLPALAYHELASQAAGVRAKELKTLFDHTRPDGSTCFSALDELRISYYTAGENIATGFSDPSIVMKGWMDSPGHKANILGKDFNAIGVGYDQGAWVQLFLGVSAPPKAVTSVTAALGKTALTVGETTTATASVLPSDAANQSVTWSSSDPSVATVSRTGTVTALRAGTAVITATASNGVKGSQTVTVTEAVVPEPPVETEQVEVTSIRVEVSGASALYVGSSTTASVEVSPYNAADKSVTWSSSDESVLTVSPGWKEGLCSVKVVGEGTASVIATAANGVTGECPVTVQHTLSDEECIGEILRLVNEERAKVGKTPLTTNRALAQAAQVRADEMPRLFEHTRPDGRDFPTALDEARVRYYMAGENIVTGAYSPEMAMKMWMSSPGHKANILQDGFTGIGIGKCGGFYVQLFVAQSGGTQPDGGTGSGDSTGSGSGDNTGSGSGSNTGSGSGDSTGTGSGSNRYPFPRFVSSSEVPADGRTYFYREDWTDGQYLEVEVLDGNQVRLSGCVKLDSLYNYAIVDAAGGRPVNRGEAPLTPGVPFTATAQVDMDILRGLYAEKPDARSMLGVMLCQNYRPGQSGYAGFHFLNISRINLVLDEENNCQLELETR